MITARSEISDTELEQLLTTARAAAQAGAKASMEWRARADELTVIEKAAADDLVSQADHDTEAAVRAMLERMRPDDGITGEEAGSSGGGSGIEWVVDPIDGTTNYLYGRPDWAVSVAAIVAPEGRILAAAVAEPAIGRVTEARLDGGAWVDGRRVERPGGTDLERALVEVNLGRPAQRGLAGGMVDALMPHVRDVRRGGSAASALAQVADGRADAYWGPGLLPWDAAAGLLIVSEAGGTVGSLAGATDAVWPASGNVLAADPDLFEPLRALLGEVYDDSASAAVLRQTPSDTPAQ
jgi:myo-inositol-1(or 4)-monophosphatase